jgi:hypothetical protein
MIGVLTDPGVGGTFFSWSIYYLRGSNDYFLVEAGQQVSITDNPLTDKNAHNFIPNLPNRNGGDTARDLKKLYEIVDCLKTINSDSQEVIYMHNLVDHNETKIGVDYLCNEVDKLIVISDKKYPLQRVTNISRGGVWTRPGHLTNDADEIFNFFCQRYFADSYQTWKELNLTNIWDKREFIALNWDPYHINSIVIEEYVDPAVDHFYLDIMEFYNFDNYIDSVFDYLELSIVPERYQSWQQTYQTWRKKHQSRLLFLWYFDKIIEYTINGYSLDLTRFNLDLQQEAAIQHCLIYQHNLNLKTWQLEKFINTKQLHNLLEPNQHNLKLFQKQ